jgi:hypothetical protein
VKRWSVSLQGTDNVTEFRAKTKMKQEFSKYIPIEIFIPPLYYVYKALKCYGVIYIYLVSFIIIIRKGEVFQGLGVKQAL